MKRTTVISSGEAAFDLISESTFLHRWLDLYGACSWGTVFQTPDFVKIWYETYREQFVPVILTMANPQGELRGLLTLAIRRSTGQLVYAGDIHSEYQVWLARDDAKDSFIFEALDLLGKTWPGQVLKLRYLPPATHLGLLAKSSWLRTKCYLAPSSRPLIGLDEEQRINRALKSKQVKLNRLKRLGAVSFRKVERDEFPEVFEHAWPLYEFRQIGRYNSSPFLSDADLKRFYLAVAKYSDVLHMTVLRVDETIVAWFLGIQSSGYLHLISTGYSPFLARHSPAMLHMLMLAKQLIRDERRVFDLTPGGDKYKDQLATSYERTHTLYFFPRLRTAIEYQQTRDLAKKAVKKLVRIAAQQPARSLAAMFGKSRDAPVPENSNRLEPEISFRICKLNAVDGGKMDERLDAVGKNKLVDLIRYESTTQAKSRRDFMNEAQRFIDQGADVYTVVRDGRLIASCWIVSGERASSSDVSISQVPAGTPLLVGFYAHPSENGAKMLSICMEKWLNEATSVGRAAQLNIGIPENDLFLNTHVAGESTSQTASHTATARATPKMGNIWFRPGSPDL